MTSAPSSSPLTGGPFRFEAAGDLPALAAKLKSAGFTPANLETLKHAIRSTTPVTRAAIERRTAARTPTNTLLRLFLLGHPVAEDALCEAIAPLPISQLLDTGLVSRKSSGDVRATGRLECRNDWFLFSDFFEQHGGTPPRADHVLGLAPSTLALADLTPRRSVESALDLGTGSGFHAMLASAHAERVVATDINPRALNFGAMNARLNGLENIEFREGSFFEPVADETFELIVANPPFVISPRTRLIFRDGGLGGDAVTERVVKGAAAHLEEGGFAVMLANWLHADADDWRVRPASWSRDLGCDAWWLRFDHDDPLSYAVHWLQQSEHGDPADSRRSLDEWVAYLEEIGAGVLSSGVIVLRKRSTGSNWLRCDSVPATTSVRPCGDQVERIFDAEDLLQCLVEDRDLLERRFQIHPEHAIHQRMAIRDGGAAIQSIELHTTRGLDFPAILDSHMLTFLAQMDGARTLREAGGAVAARLSVDFELAAPTCLEIARKLLRNGLITPV